MKNSAKIFRYFILIFIILLSPLSLLSQIEGDDYYDSNYHYYNSHVAAYDYEGDDYDVNNSYYSQRFAEYSGADSIYWMAVAAFYTGRDKDAEKLYDKALLSGDSKFYSNFANYFLAQNEEALYKKHLSRWMKDRPTAKAPFMYQADIYKTERSYDKAVAVYEELIAKYSDYGPSYVSLITLYKELGKNESALKIAEKYAKVNFKDERAYVELAALYKQLNRTDDAIKTYEKAMSLFPKTSSFHYSLSELYRKKGNIKKANELLEQYNIKFRTSSAQTKTTAYNFLSGLSSASSETLTKLLKEYEAKTVKSSDEDDLLILTGLYQMTGDYGKAANVLEKAIQAGVKTELIYRTLASIYDDVKNYAGLVRCYEALAAGVAEKPKKDEPTSNIDNDNDDNNNSDDEVDVATETVSSPYTGQQYIFRPYRSSAYSDYYGNQDRSYYKLQIANVYQDLLKNNDKAIKILEELVANTDKKSDQYSTYVTKLGEVYERSERYKDALALYEKDPKKFEYKLLEIYRKNGEEEKIISYYENKLKQDPHDFNAYSQLGATYVSMNKLVEAEAVYKKYVEQAKESAESLGALARFYETTTNNYEKAIKIYADLLDRAYKNSEDQLIPDESVKGLADLYLKIRKPEEAVRVYERFLQVNPQSFETYDKVYAIYKKYLKNFDKALDAFEKRSQVCTTYPEEDYKRQLELADLYEKFKRFDKAIVVYQNLIRAKNKIHNSYEVSYYYDGGAMIRLLGLYYILEKHKEAEAYLQDAIKKNPKNSVSFRASLADYYKKIKAYEKAIPLYEALIDETFATEKDEEGSAEVIDDVSDDYYYYSGDNSAHTYMEVLSGIYLLMGQYDKAADVFLKRINGKKLDDIPLYVKAAKLYASSDDKKYLEKAVGLYKKAMEINEQQDVISGLVNVYATLERYDEAIKLVNRLISMSKKDRYNYYYYWFTLSGLYEKKGSFDLALEALDVYEKEYKKIYPEVNEYSYYISQRAYLYARKAAAGPEASKAASYKTAVDLINKALKTSKNSSNELYNAACIYAIAGNKKEALVFLEKALAAGFDSKEHIKKDKDMDILRDTDEFKKIIKKYFGE